MVKNFLKKARNQHKNYRIQLVTLTLEWREFRELYIEPDWLLIYEITSNKKTVIFTRTETYSDLF